MPELFGGIDAEAAAEAEALLGKTEEEAERALLARFLYSPPPRQLVAGERNGLDLDRVLKQLQALFRMLSGRPLRLAYSEPAATDNQNLYLPRALPAPEEGTDLLLFRVMGLVQLGFLGHGLLRERALLAEIHRDWVLRSAFHLLAARAVLGQWARDYPGFAEDLGRVAWLDKAGIMRVNVTVVPREGMPGAFLPLYEDLTHCLNWRKPGMEGDPAREAVAWVRRQPTVQASAILAQARKLREHFKKLRLGPPPLPFYLGIIRPEWMLAELARDVAYEQEWKQGNKPLRQLLEAIARKGGAAPPPPSPAPVARPSLRERLAARLSGPDMSKAPAYGRLRDAFVEEQKSRPEEALFDVAAPPGEEGVAFDEWDHSAGVYRVGVTRVRTVDSPTGDLNNYLRIVEANHREISQIRRRFAALRPEERWLHGQRDGSELDLGRLITALSDIRAGSQPDDRIHKRFVRRRQPIAILTLVDVSGSTQGRVIYVEQEALVLLAEGLRVLDMPHAFYGFSNDHPQNCLLQRVKSFDDGYDDVVHRRLGNLRAGGATRLGAFLRAGTELLARQPQARRLMLVLSDGKPEDRGEYRGSYGIHDSAMAVQEARKARVNIFCISLDAAEDSQDYLEPIFGRSGFLRLSNIEHLPKRLPELLRRMVQ